ncbi:MAG TPA: response regulator, partial [Gammaproteobacteria bacterium]|nr:response regulator [Gammaproteobacteria bacterium]
MSSSPVRILLVDDDRLVLGTMGQGLRGAGYTVVEAASGKEAVERVQAQDFDLAILDMRMPGMSGIDVAHYLSA